MLSASKLYHGEFDIAEYSTLFLKYNTSHMNNTVKLPDDLIRHCFAKSLVWGSQVSQVQIAFIFLSSPTFES